MDYLSKQRGVLVEVKSNRTINNIKKTNELTKNIIRQIAYNSLLVGIEDIECYLLFCESQWGINKPKCGLFEITKETLNEAKKEILEDIKAYSKCLFSGYFPSKYTKLQYL